MKMLELAIFIIVDGNFDTIKIIGFFFPYLEVIRRHGFLNYKSQVERTKSILYHRRKTII